MSSSSPKILSPISFRKKSPTAANTQCAYTISSHILLKNSFVVLSGNGGLAPGLTKEAHSGLSGCTARNGICPGDHTSQLPMQPQHSGGRGDGEWRTDGQSPSTQEGEEKMGKLFHVARCSEDFWHCVLDELILTQRGADVDANHAMVGFVFPRTAMPRVKSCEEESNAIQLSATSQRATASPLVSHKATTTFCSRCG